MDIPKGLQPSAAGPTVASCRRLCEILAIQSGASINGKRSHREMLKLLRNPNITANAFLPHCGVTAGAYAFAHTFPPPSNITIMHKECPDVGKPFALKRVRENEYIDSPPPAKRHKGSITTFKRFSFTGCNVTLISNQTIPKSMMEQLQGARSICIISSNQRNVQQHKQQWKSVGIPISFATVTESKVIDCDVLILLCAKPSVLKWMQSALETQTATPCIIASDFCNGDVVPLASTISMHIELEEHAVFPPLRVGYGIMSKINLLYAYIIESVYNARSLCFV